MFTKSFKKIDKFYSDRRVCKIIENTQRDVNIALINEVFKNSLLKINSNDVLKAAATKWNF